MTDVVNLRMVRKARARVVQEAQAAANRTKFGRTKAARAADAEEQARREALLDGAKRE